METMNLHSATDQHIADYEAIVKTMQYYIDGSRAGKSELMRLAFHANATLVGYVADGLLFHPVQFLYDWIDNNGPAPDIKPHLASIEILHTIAEVRLEVEQWSGNMAGSGVHMSDLFNLVKTEEGWKISQKLFHWHGL